MVHSSPPGSQLSGWGSKTGVSWAMGQNPTVFRDRFPLFIDRLLVPFAGNITGSVAAPPWRDSSSDQVVTSADSRSTAG